MEPMPETVRAVEELGPFASEDDLLDELRAMADRVVEVVPDCVGMSVASSEHGVTFTLLDTRLGVVSSLSLPIGHGSGVAGCVNLYGASVGSFEGRHEQLAHTLGGRADRAEANADLSFTTRFEAVDAPRRLLARSTLDEAADVVEALFGVDRAGAIERIRRSSRRAGISSQQFAEALLKLHADQ